MNIQVDLGNLWEMLSATGTIGAVVVSLYLARKSDMQRVSVVFESAYRISDEQDQTEYATITATNIGNPPITIIEVGLKRSKLSGGRMPLLCSYGVFDNKLPLKIESSETEIFGNTAENFRKLFVENEPSYSKVYAYAKTTTGRIFYSKEKYRIV